MYMTTDGRYSGTFCLVAGMTGLSEGRLRGNFGLDRSYLILLNRSHMPRSEACGHKIFLATDAKPGHSEERFHRSGSRTRIVTVTPG